MAAKLPSQYTTAVASLERGATASTRAGADGPGEPTWLMAEPDPNPEPDGDGDKGLTVTWVRMTLLEGVLRGGDPHVRGP